MTLKARRREHMPTLIKASNGMVYGTTKYGGPYEAGIFYEINPVSNTFKLIKSFNGLSNDKNGSQPYGTLIEGPDGLIYGTAVSGGLTNRGVIYSYDPILDTITKLHDFNNVSYNPYGGLTWNADSTLLYGTTSAGGLARGSIFSFEPITKNYNVLYDFAGAVDGYGPDDAMFLAKNGLLYGISDRGGINNGGTIFSFDPTTDTFTKLIDLNSTTTGTRGENTFVEGKNGNLYTTLSHSIGRVISYNYISNMVSTVFNAPVQGGRGVRGNMYLSEDSNFVYGAFYENDTSFHGVIYQYDLILDTLIEFASLTSINGIYAHGDLTFLECAAPVSTVLSSDTIVCEGESLDLTIMASGFDTRQWTLNGTGLGIDADMLSLTNIQQPDSGEYRQEYNNVCGLVTSDPIAVNVEALPHVNAGADTNICTGDSIVLNAVGNAFSYGWSQGIVDGNIFYQIALTRIP